MSYRTLFMVLFVQSKKGILFFLVGGPFARLNIKTEA